MGEIMSASAGSEVEDENAIAEEEDEHEKASDGRTSRTRSKA